MHLLPERRVPAFSPAGRVEEPAGACAPPQTLDSLDLMNVLREPEFQELTLLASQMCGTPISLITLLDPEKQWITSSVGTDLQETSREVAFCSHAIKTPNVYVIENAAEHPLFAQIPLVTGGPEIRFYAGIPLTPPDGTPFGTLCVIDTKARQMSEAERTSLAIIGRQVQTRLELRAQNLKLQRSSELNLRLTQSLEESNDLFLAFMDHSPLPAYIKDAGGAMVFYNRQMADHFAVSTEDWLGKLDDEIWPEAMAEQFRENDRAVLESGHPQELSEVSPGQHDGRTYWRSYKFPFRNRRGELMLAGMSVDVSDAVMREKELAEINRRLELLAATDALTGLANRRVFEAKAQAAFSHACDRSDALSLMVIDLDDFKRRNDHLGHAAGDEALRLVGGLLASVAGEGSLAARIGGEEFALILPGLEGGAVRELGNKLRTAFRGLEAGAMPLTASIGIASYDGLAKDWQRLLARADDAMYDAKRSGKDRVVMHEDVVARLMNEMQAKFRAHRRAGRAA